MIDYISKTKVHAPWGYQDHCLLGIGQWMMFGGAQAIERYRDADAQNLDMWQKTMLKTAAVFIGVISSPLTLVGAVVKGIGMQFPVKIGPLTSKSMPATAPKKIDQIYELLGVFNEVCSQHGLKYFIEGGTLLGAVRNKGIIPWDDDADVGIMENDQYKLKEMEQSLNARGCQLISYEKVGKPMFQLCFKPEVVRDRFRAEKEETGFMDIFPYSERKDGIVHYTETFMRSSYPDGYFLKKNLDQLIEYPFGPPEKRLMLKGTSEPEEHLKRNYGEECLEYGVQTHNHTSFFGLGIPIPNFSMAKYKIIQGDYAKGEDWK